MSSRWRLTGATVLATVLLGMSHAARVCAECSNPQYGWTRTMGGTGEDHCDAVAVDSGGNVIITGRFAGTVDFDPTAGLDNRASQGREDVFVTKLTTDGSYSWTRTIGGPRADIAYGLAVDPDGSVLLTGSFHGGVDFDPTEGVDHHVADGAYEDVFVTKLNADGTYAWTCTFGAAASDRGQSIAAGGSGEVFVTGFFRNTVDFDPGVGTDEHISGGGYDIFVSKFTVDGSHAWTRTFGDWTGDWGTGVAVDGDGNVLVTGGYTNTVDFDPGPGVDNHTPGGVFVTKLGNDGSYAWTRTFGVHIFGAGLNDSFAWAIAADVDGNSFVTGYFYGWIDFDPSGSWDIHQSAGQTDVFITKLHADGSYAWTSTIGSYSYDTGLGVTVAPDGDVLATGFFSMEADFDPTDGEDKQSSKGWRDLFVTRLHTDGTYAWAKTMGEIGMRDTGYAVASGSNGDVVIAGRFDSAFVDFDPGAATDEHLSNGALDIFVTKFECGD